MAPGGVVGVAGRVGRVLSETVVRNGCVWCAHRVRAEGVQCGGADRCVAQGGAQDEGGDDRGAERR